MEIVIYVSGSSQEIANFSAPCGAIFKIFWVVMRKGHVQYPFEFYHDQTMYVGATAKKPMIIRYLDVGYADGAADFSVMLSSITEIFLWVMGTRYVYMPVKFHQNPIMYVSTTAEKPAKTTIATI